MADPTDDAERIAALLDGRLDARQRAEVLARLGESDAALEAFVDAAAVLREAPEASVRPIARPQAWRKPALALAAALIVGAIIVPLVRWQNASAREGGPRQFVALLGPGGLPSGLEPTPWSTTRGGGEPLTDSARAIRIGARLTDLSVAITAGDSVTPKIAAEIAAQLEPIPASAPAVSIFNAIASPTATKHERTTLFSQASDAAADIAGRKPVSFAAWLEAARIAALRHDAAFFNSATSRGVMTREPTLRGIRVGSGTDWATVERDLSGLLGELGS